jgi:CSLREA domain-containing protein
MRGRRESIILAVLALMAAPAVAQAETGKIAGNPLDVYADGVGSLQFRFNTQAEGVFYGPDDDVADAGLEIRESGLYYPLRTGRRAISGPDLTTVGAGTRALHSVYGVGDHLEVTEDVTYTDQSHTVALRYAIRNVSDAPVSFGAGELADLYAAGNDDGTGVLEPGPPRFVGGASVNGSVTGLVESTPWTHHQSGEYSDVFGSFGAGGLNDSIHPELVDNGVGAEWVVDALAPGQSTTIAVTWRLGEATQTTRVTTTADHLNDSGTPCTPDDCTLREAVGYAPAGSTIEIPAGNYALPLGELTLSNVSLRGAGADRTTIAAEGSRALSVLSGRSSISGLRISGGNGESEARGGYGGGVYVDVEAALALTDAVVSDNRAAVAGGGIYSAGVLSVSRSLIARNTGTATDGFLLGGGIAVDGGRTSIANSTLSANSALTGGGVWFSGGGVVSVLNATIAHNAGEGIYISPPSRARRVAANPNGNVTVQNTILAANAGGACGGDVPGVTGHSLSDDGTCAFAGAGDRQNTNAGLQPLTGAGVHPLAPGSAALDTADDALCPGSDQLGTARPQGAHCDTGAYELPVAPPPVETVTPTPTPTVGAPAPTPAPVVPTPTPTPPAPLPAPVAGKTVNAQTKSGKVLFKLPGSSKFAELGPGRQLRVGTVIDASKGRITLTAAADRKGKTQSADFYDGIFKIGQSSGAKPVTELTLVEALSCKAKSSSASAAAKKPKSRRLWGDGKGQFRTRGQFSSATVRGTVWLTEDRCDRTLTRVKQGVVEVRDLVKRKTVLVKAGKQYLARAKRG